MQKGLEKKIFVLIFTFAFLFTIDALPATVITVPPGGDIQAAINAIDVGGTINLEAGTYPLTEQLIINKALTLAGVGIDASIVQSPNTAQLTNTFSYTGITSATFTPVIIVENAIDVILENFQVDGRDQSVFGVISHFSGIGFHNASGSILNLHVLNIMESTEPTGYQEGAGIVIANDSGANTATIRGCTLDQFQKQGILAIGTGLSFLINQNTITGNSVEANPNGIELYDGSTGTISNNMITNLTNLSTQACCGILAFNAINLIVENNTADTNDNGFYLFDCDNLTISNNILNNNIDSITIDNSGASVANSSYLTLNTIFNDTSLGPLPTFGVTLYSPTTALVNPQSFFDSNTFNSSTYGLVVNGNSTDTAGPIVSMHNDTFVGASPKYYIQMVSCPNDIWPTTRTVSFNGLISGEMTLAQFDALVTNPITQQIYDKNTDPSLGLVLTYVLPESPNLTGLSPTLGPAEGGTIVTITGSNFIRGSQVLFGNVFATNIDVISDTIILATSPPGSGTAAVTVVTANGVSPPVNAGTFTYISDVPLPPSVFQGVISEDKFLFQNNYFLISHWDASPSHDIKTYRIYKNQCLVKEVPANSFFIFKSFLKSKRRVHYTITAVNSNGGESIPAPLVIVNEYTFCTM